MKYIPVINKKVYLLFFSLLIVKVVWSQNNKMVVDSVLQQAGTIYRTDPQKGIALAKNAYDLSLHENLKPLQLACLRMLTNMYWDIPDYPKAITYAEKGVETAKLTGIDSLCGDFLVMKGGLEHSQNNYSTALISYREALPYYQQQQLPQRLANTYLNIGICEMKLSRFETANTYFLKAVIAFDSLNNISDLSAAYNAMGVCFLSLNDPLKSIQYHRLALGARQQLKDATLIAQSYNNIGQAFKNLPKPDSALLYLFKCLAMRSNQKDSSLLVLTLQNIGATYLQMENPARAAPYINRSLNIAAAYNMREATVRGQLDLAKVYLLQQNYQQALTAVEKAERGASDLELPELLVNAYETRYTIYNNQDDYRQALHYYRLKTQLKDSLFTVAQSRAISELEMKYQTAQKEKDIALLNAQNLLQKKIVGQQSISIIALIFGALFLSVLLFLAYRNYRIKHRAAQRIHTLMRELHHRVKNNLQILAGLFAMQINEQSDEHTRSTLRENEMRLMSMNLIHNKLYQNETDTKIAIKEYLNGLMDLLKVSFAGSGNDAIKVHTTIDDILLDADIAVAIGLIVNELVTNSLKYAFGEQGGEIHLELRKTENAKLLLEVKDNGKGMKNASQDRERSFGLKLVYLLVRQLKASLTLQSENGTSYKMNIDLK